MKKIWICAILITFMLQGFSQEAKSVEKQEEKQAAADSSRESTKVVAGKDIVKIEENNDAVRIRIGDRSIEVLESLEGGTTVRIEKHDDDDEYAYRDDDDENDRRRRDRNRFQGHWAGVEFGLNNYTTSNWSNPLPDDIYFMDLHTSKSNNFTVNFAQLSLGFSRHTGIVTGLGMTWNEYRFDGNNNIQQGATGIIEPVYPEQDLKKSKFTTTYLTLPVLFEFQIPADNNNINVATGIIGAVKLCSDSKMVTAGGEKIKSNDDLSLNVLRYGATARLGYSVVQVFATYYLTPLFKTGKGPGGYELFPWEIGLALTFND